MKYTLSLVLFALCITKLTAQQEYKKYQWSENPVVSDISESEKEYPAVVIKDVKLIEHEYKMQTASTYQTEHRIIHINSDAGIEKYNKIYIPMRANTELIDLQVRSISPTGKVTPIQRKNIKELENVEGFSNVKIFAIEGLEVGGEAEYLYTSKMGFEPFGRETIQRDIPVKEVGVMLFYPTKWSFADKSYNGLPLSKAKNISGKKSMKYVTAKEIPAYHEEEYALYEPKLMRYEYKLVNNGYKSNLFSWQYLSIHMIAGLTTPKGSRAGLKFTKELQDNGMSEEEKIRALENKIKTTIKRDKGYSEALGDPGAIIKNGVGNSRGIAKLFIYCLDALGIKNEIVYCVNRFDGELDPDFANPSDIRDMLIYFPKYDSYLMPDAYHMRYGVPHTGLMGSKGLFAKYKNEFNKLSCYSYYFQDLKTLDKEVNHMGMIANIQFEDDLRKPSVAIENYAQGYRAFAYRSAFHYGNSSQQEEFVKDVTLSSYETYDMKGFEVEGSDIKLSSYPEEFFKIKMKYTTPELVEKAGNEYLIAVGKVIGKQSELYQEKARQHDIAFHSISNYHHEITISIPEGYVLEGLENIKINNAVKVDDEDVMYFISDFTQSDNSLTIVVDEVYSVLNLSKTYYNDFRDVINSAADFNKLTLIMRKAG